MAGKNRRFINCKPDSPVILLDGPWKDDRLTMIHGLLVKRGWQARLLDVTQRIPGTVAGAITLSRPDTPVVEELYKKGCPTVRMGSFANPGDDRIPAVLPDYHAAGLMAADHFAERQYKDVVTVGAAKDAPGPRSKTLFSGFSERAAELGMTCHYYSTNYEGILSDSKSERGQRRKEAYQRLFAELPKPCGLFAPTDRMAIQICEACSDAGVEMPGEIAVLGYGNNLICDMTEVPVSSIEPDMAGICMQAVALLARLMEGNKPASSPIFVPPVRIVERASTDVLAAADPEVRKALNFIWDNIDQDLSVDDVVAEVGLSRNALQRRLKQDIGRGIAEELRRRRLECVCDLLRTTELTVEEIASKTGFRYKSYLHRAFLKRFGVTPQAYRNG